MIISKVSELFPITKTGNIIGNCVVCGDTTNHGMNIDFSENFTAANILQAGDCICPHCYEFARNQKYRKNSWLANKDGVRFIKRNEILQILQKPPEPPFCIYITTTGKKQSYLQLIRKLSYSKTKYFIGFDDDVIYVDENPTPLIEFATSLRTKKISKKELLSAKIHPYNYAKLTLSELDMLNTLALNRLWRLIVYVVE